MNKKGISSVVATALLLVVAVVAVVAFQIWFISYNSGLSEVSNNYDNYNHEVHEPNQQQVTPMVATNDRILIFNESGNSVDVYTYNGTYKTTYYEKEMR